MGGPALVEQDAQRGKLNNGEQLDYAFGLVIGNYRGLATVDHAGADAGYRSDMIRFPDQHFTAACLCNLATANPSRTDAQGGGDLSGQRDETRRNSEREHEKARAAYAGATEEQGGDLPRIRRAMKC